MRLKNIFPLKEYIFILSVPIFAFIDAEYTMRVYARTRWLAKIRVILTVNKIQRETGKNITWRWL